VALGTFVVALGAASESAIAAAVVVVVALAFLRLAVLKRREEHVSLSAAPEHVATPAGRLDRLRAIYHQGYLLHGRLPWLGGAPESRADAEALEYLRRRKVIDWGWETVELLAQCFPGQERRFAPDVDLALRKTGFWLEIDEQLKTQTPESYMDAKLNFLASLIEREEAGRPSQVRPAA